MNGKILKHAYHRFLDETGDPTFYGKAKSPIVGLQGVSTHFTIGMLTLNTDVDEVRGKIIDLQNEIANDKYFKSVPSLLKRKSNAGFFLHAKDDVPEIRKMAFELINNTDCYFEAVVGRKDYDVYEKKHSGKQAEFYADLLSHLLTDKVPVHDKLVLNIAHRSQCTTHKNLEKGLENAIARARIRYPEEENCCQMSFNVQRPTQEPIINMADYFLWALNRKFEKNEERYMEFLEGKFKSVQELEKEELWA